MSIPASYEQGFCAWIARNVELLRAGSLSEIDAEHIAEELESMGKRDLRQLRSRLQVLTLHLLKWKYQPDLRGSSCQLTCGPRPHQASSRTARSVRAARRISAESLECPASPPSAGPPPCKPPTSIPCPT